MGTAGNVASKRDGNDRRDMISTIAGRRKRVHKGRRDSECLGERAWNACLADKRKMKRHALDDVRETACPVLFRKPYQKAPSYCSSG
jgi:hypothetical protein